MAHIAAIVSEIFSTFRRNGHRLAAEGVTRQQHALQCASLAGDAGEPSDIITACLLHDFGHLLVDPSECNDSDALDPRHELVGANYLACWFEPAVVEPIRLHSMAKRYLCWKEPGYYRALTEGSRRRLALHGGAMTDAEAFEFEVNPHFSAAVRVRRYDDRARVPGFLTPDLEVFRPLLLHQAARAREQCETDLVERAGRSGRSRRHPASNAKALDPETAWCADR